MAYIGRDTDKISNVEVLDNITFNGSSSYTLQKGGSNFTPSSANTILLSIDGVVQAGNFTVSGSTIDFGTAVAGTSTCDFILHYGIGLITSVSDGTVTEAKIGSGAVTSAKLSYPLTTFSSTGIDDNATSTAITIDSSQQVGIGTASPTAMLELFKAGTTQIKNAYSSTKYSLFGRTGGNYYWSAYEGGANLIFSTSASDNATTERMRITSSGGVNVGSEGTAGTAVGLNVHNHGWSTMATFKTGTSTNAQYIQFINSNGTVGSINMSGSSTSYNTSSDYRLKENVSYDFDATTRLKQLKPARFNFISDANKTVDGFIAHEVSSVVPEAISGEKDAIQVWKEGEKLPEGVSVGDNKLDENGNTIIEAQGIDQSKLVPLLVKTIQELEARITALENA